MSSSYYSLFAILLIFILLRREERKRAYIMIKKRKKEGKKYMGELLSKFVGKYVSIDTLNGNYGLSRFIVKEVNENGVLLEEKNGSLRLINTEFIVGVHEEKPWK